MKLHIPSLVLASCLTGAENSFPSEFLGLLAGFVQKDLVVVEKLYLAPLAESDENEVSFDFTLLPPLSNVVGTFHSHPRGVAFPSKQDLLLYAKIGFAHAIAAGPPFKLANTKAFDKLGKPIQIEIRD